MAKSINIGLIGAGTIGQGIIKILKKNTELIEKRTGIKVNLAKVCDKNIDPAKKLGVVLRKLTTNIDNVLNDKKIDIIVELVGGYEPAKTLILKALKKKKHVVTANKALIAKHGAEIFKEADKNQVHVLFEASVGGCIPVLRAIRESYIGDEIQCIYGIVNGTTNYILSKMEQGVPYNAALLEAQKLGFAEADPSFDVDGKDSAQKLSILAGLAFNTLIKEEFLTCGITQLSANDLKYASEMGYAVKLLAIAKKEDKKIELRVHPTMIPRDHELANVKNEMNAVFVVGEHISEAMLYGKGAGQLPTATVVIGDVIDIAKKLRHKEQYTPSFFNNYPLKNVDSIKSRYYLRYSVVDKPGVLAKITTVLGKNNISIAGVWQKEEDQEVVPVVMTTHEASEKDLMQAVKDIDKLDVVKDKTVVIRIEDLK